MLEFVSKLHWLWILQVIYLSIKKSSYFLACRSYFEVIFFIENLSFFFHNIFSMYLFFRYFFFEMSCSLLDQNFCIFDFF